MASAKAQRLLHRAHAGHALGAVSLVAGGRWRISSSHGWAVAGCEHRLMVGRSIQPLAS